MCMQTIMFFVTTLKNMKHDTITHLAARKKTCLCKKLDRVFSACKDADFRIKTIQIDPKMIEIDIKIND